MHIVANRQIRYNGNDTTSLGIGEWKPSNTVLTTKPHVVRTCIAFVAHNSLSRQGLMGHFSALKPEPGLQSDEEAFKAALSAVPSLGDPKQTTMWLSGGSQPGSRSEDLQIVAQQVSEDRAYALKHVLACIRKHDLPDLEITWSPPDTDIELTLDCYQGLLIVESHNTIME